MTPLKNRDVKGDETIKTYHLNLQFHRLTETLVNNLKEVT